MVKRHCIPLAPQKIFCLVSDHKSPKWGHCCRSWAHYLLLLVKHRARWSPFSLVSDRCVRIWTFSLLSLVPARSAPGALWLTSSPLVSLTLRTLVGWWQKSWTPQNPCPSIRSGKRMTSSRETCWCSSFWRLPGEACSTLSHGATVLISTVSSSLLYCIIFAIVLKITTDLAHILICSWSITESSVNCASRNVRVAVLLVKQSSRWSDNNTPTSFCTPSYWPFICTEEWIHPLGVLVDGQGQYPPWELCWVLFLFSWMAAKISALLNQAWSPASHPPHICQVHTHTAFRHTATTAEKTHFPSPLAE